MFLPCFIFWLSGQWFVENTGEDDWYRNSESSSESDDFI